jgi:hypothetical protein
MFNSTRVPKAIPTYLFLASLAFLPTSAWAGDCSESSSEPLWDCELDLNLEQGKLINNFGALLSEFDELQSGAVSTLTITGFKTHAKTNVNGYLGTLGEENQRANEVIWETDNSDFEDIVAQGGKTKGKNCDWDEAPDVEANPEAYLPAGLHSPSIELGNSDCDKFTAKDVDNENVTVNERSLPNVCLRVCGDDEVADRSLYQDFSNNNAKKPKKREKIKIRHIARKNEGIDAAEEANLAIESATIGVMQMNARIDAFGLDYAIATTFPECVAPDDTTKVVAWYVKTISSGILPFLKINKQVADAIADVAEPATRQDVLGNNVSSANIPAVIYKHVSEGLVTVAETVIVGADLTIEGFELFSNDTTLSCLAAIRSQVHDISESVIDLNKKVGDSEERLKKLIMENRSYIENVREIVLTPHGQRNRVPLYDAPPPPTEEN